MWSQRTSDWASQDGQTFRASFSEAYQVEHTPDTTELQIRAASGIPQLRSFYPGTYVPCVGTPITKVGPAFSILTARYEGETGPNQQTESPENMLPIYVWSDTTSTEPIDEDWDGKPIVTANGEPISGVTMELADQTLTVTRNYLAFSPWLTHQYRHSVNSDVFASYPPGTARLVQFSASSEYSDTRNFSYWKVNAKIQFRYPYNTTPARAWWARVRHEGYYIREGSKIVRAVDCNKEPTVKPVLLKADGTRNLKAGSNCEDDDDTAQWLEFKRYNSLPYSTLGLLA